METIWQRSFWEIERYFHDTELLVIGSGIVGLSAALQYRKKRPNAKILVLDQGILPYGASTRNAGFACIGSVTELLSDFEISGPEKVISLISLRNKGLKALFRNLGKTSCDYNPVGGFELLQDEETAEKCNQILPFLNRELRKVTQLKETFCWPSPKQLKSFGFQGVHKLLLNKAEGHLHTGKMMDSLLLKVQNKGIRTLFNTEVLGFEKNKRGWEVETNHGFSFETNKILICTNGFAKKLIPQLDVKPARAQVLITERIPDLPFKGTFHLEEGFYYFRDLDQRILLGGGRNLDFETETTTDFNLTPLIQQKLEQLLEQIILPGKKIKIEHRWSGIMGVGSEKLPIIQSLDYHLACAVRMGGMGVAIGTLAGEMGADILLEN